MEKLQAALNKARKQRDETPEAPTASVMKGAVDHARARGQDTSGWSEVPLVAMDRKHLVRNRVLTAGGSDPQSASFDLLRTKIQLQMEKNSWRRMAITSPSKSAGKTTVCANLAMAFSRQKSKRVIVFEFDMRRPALARVMGLSPERSTAEVLRGEVSFAEQAVRIGESVAVSCNPAALSSPSDLFLDPSTIKMLETFEKQYQPDLVIFDLPPLYAADDATAFFPNVDCALLIAEAEKCTIQQIDTSERRIAEHTNFLGVVLNKCRYPEEHEGYGYGYGSYS